MSAADSIRTRPLTVAQRANEATQWAADALQLTDLKRLGAAVALAAAEELGRNRSFAALVRMLYDDLAPKRPTRAPSKAKPVAPDVDLVPIKSMEGYKYDPVAPPDPYFLYEFYGAAQL